MDKQMDGKIMAQHQLCVEKTVHKKSVTVKAPFNSLTKCGSVHIRRKLMAGRSVLCKNYQL